jgi:hypothetical protein
MDEIRRTSIIALMAGSGLAAIETCLVGSGVPANGTIYFMHNIGNIVYLVPSVAIS